MFLITQKSFEKSFDSFLGSVFQYGYGLGVMNSLQAELKQIHIKSELNFEFTTGKYIKYLGILQLVLLSRVLLWGYAIKNLFKHFH